MKKASRACWQADFFFTKLNNAFMQRYTCKLEDENFNELSIALITFEVIGKITSRVITTIDVALANEKHEFVVTMY